MKMFSINKNILFKFINQNKASRNLIYQFAKLNQDNQKYVEFNNDHNKLNQYELNKDNQSDLNKDNQYESNKDNQYELNKLNQYESNKDNQFILNNTQLNELDNLHNQNNQLENLDKKMVELKNKFSLLNENSLSNQVLKMCKTRTKKSYETKLDGNMKLELLKVNYYNCIIYENNEFVNRIIKLLSDELNLSLDDARIVFFSFGYLPNKTFNSIFGNERMLERKIKKLKLNLTNEQIINGLISFRWYDETLKSKFSIFKLIGLNSNLSSIKNFTMIMNQTESNLKELNLLDKNANILDNIFSKLNLDYNLENKIKSKFIINDKQTIYDILNDLSKYYLKFNLDIDLNEKNSIHYLDLLNIIKLIEFIDNKYSELNVQYSNLDNRSAIFKLARNKKFFKIGHDDLIIIDNYLKNNNIQFFWTFFLNPDRSYYKSLYDLDLVMSRIEFLIDQQIPLNIIKKHFYVFYNKQHLIKFYLNQFGNSFFDYPSFYYVLTKNHQIMERFRSLNDDEKKELKTFSQFMEKYFDI